MVNRGQVLVLLITLGVLFSAIPLSTIPVDANPLTTVILELQEEPVEVDVSPGSSGIVEVEGTVTCKKFGPDEVKVSLMASSETGGASLEPPSFVFSGVSGSEETKSFSVSTRVPKGYTSSATPTLTVGGYYDQGGLRTTVQPVSITIIILQYYKIRVDIKDREITIKEGEKAYIGLKIDNLGNGEDTFLIDFENRKDLEDRGLKLLEPKEYIFPENEAKAITLVVGAREDISGNFNLRIFVLSKASEESDSQEKVFIHCFLNIKQSVPGQIVSFFISPITLAAALIIVVVVFVLRRKQKKGISSNVNP